MSDASSHRKVFFFFSIFLLGILGKVSVDEEIVIITPTWNVTRHQLNNFTSMLETLKEDRWGWHWGSEVDSKRWIKQGFIDQSELDFLNKGTGARGGGFYISWSCSDSRSYGPWPVGTFLPKGTLILTAQSDEALTAIGVGVLSITNEMIVALGRIVPFVDNFSATWSVVHNNTLTSKIALAYSVPQFTEGPYEADSELSYRGLWSAMQEVLTKNVSLADSANKMMKHWTLLEFLGPLKANAMRVKYGNDIWNHIDSQKFERYHNYLLSIAFKKMYFPRGFACSSGVFNCQNATDWASYQVNNVLPQIWNSTEFRGDESVQFVTVVQAQYDIIRQSPYLEVLKARELPSNKTWNVQYRNPTVLNIKQLWKAGKISADLLNNITAYPIDHLKSNDALRRSLNARLMKELLVDLFNKSFNGQTFDGVSVSSFYQDWMRIRPFQSDNHLIRRLYERTVAIYGRGYQRAPNGFLEIFSESAEYFPSYFYFRSALKFSKTFFEIRKKGYVEVTKPLFFPDYKPDYFVGWDQINQDFLTYTEETIHLDANAVDLILNKKMVELMDRSFSRWRKVVALKTTIELSPTWFISQEQIDELRSLLPSLEKDVIAIIPIQDASKAMDWDILGRIGDFRDVQTLIPMETINSNSEFLSFLTTNLPLATVMKQGTKYLDVTKGTKEYWQIVLGEVEMENIAFITKAADLLAFFHYYYGTASEKIVEKVTLACRLPEYNVQVKVRNEYGRYQVDFWSILLNIHQKYNSADALEILRTFLSVEYLKPLQANRLRIQHGHEFWKQPELEGFDRYAKVIINNTLNIMKNDSYFQIGKYGSINDDPSMEVELISTLKTLWKEFTQSEEGMFREEESFKTTVVAEFEYKVMNESPYLNVEVVERLSNGTMRIKYQNPSIFDISKLASSGKISNSLKVELSSYSKDQLEQNKKNLTRVLMEDILKIALSTLRRQRGSSPAFISFLQDWDRIRPLKRENYHMRKIFERMIYPSLYFNGNSETFLELNPEITSLLPTSSFNASRIRTDSVGANVLDLLTVQMDQFFKKVFRSESHSIDFFYGWNNTYNTLSINPLVKATFNEEGMKWIEKGDFISLYNRDFPQWKNSN